MIEFNIQGDPDDVQRVIERIRTLGIPDARVNITAVHPGRISSSVPPMRLRHIARVVAAMTDDRRLGLLKKELVELLVSDGLSPATASVYVSGASGAGVIERSENGYCLTSLGRSLL